MPFRVVIAPDKFRGSLTALEAAGAMARGVRLACPEAEVDVAPMADGGEGTVEAIVTATGGTFVDATVTGPLGTPVVARYGRLGDGRSAVLEMAAASGLALVPQNRRDPLRTTSRGTGELLLHAIEAGATRVVLGIGGSATNDGGVGMAQALGYRFLDVKGREIGPGGGALADLERIDVSQRNPKLDGVAVEVACDVDNPLCGPQGASAVFGPQKGANADAVARLDRNLGKLARVIARDLGGDVLKIGGGGAAGGLGAGLVTFASGTLGPGIELVIRAVGLADRLHIADLCLTGEGSIDASSAFGKTAVGVARLARSLGRPTIAIGGALGHGAEDVLKEGVDAIFGICRRPVSLETALTNADEWLASTTRQAVAAFLAGREAAKPGNRHE